ncbi:hypothetical protein R5W23_003367 [Gemmata sp. JC673]|uniref:DUF1559 domain-containing protein n=1 Tax=Gemmata algarum TaxID=2975278 RepID=A0ABU5F2X6_9BACT|nr:hypothetical protein [Gemmata algarum]MDY3561937.1 hypothetical protein [Gemmata algarum]
MKLGTGLATNQTRQHGNWSPAKLPGLFGTIYPALARLHGLLWQDIAKTVPAVTHLDPVRVAECPYTGHEFTAPSDNASPILRDEGGGKWSLLFDGVDDNFVVSSPTAFPSGGAPVTIAAAVTPASVIGTQMLTWITYAGGNAAIALSIRLGKYQAEKYGASVLIQSSVMPMVDTPFRCVYSLLSGKSNFLSNGVPENVTTVDTNTGSPETLYVGQNSFSEIYSGRVSLIVYAASATTGANLASLDALLASVQP